MPRSRSVKEAEPTAPAGVEWASLLQEIVIDRSSSIPPVEQIQSDIRHRLATGRIKVGSRMPSARTLAAAIGVTSATVGRAYAGLQAESLLTSVVGVGTTVASVADLGLAAREQMQRQGIATLNDAIRTMRAGGLSTTDVRAALHTTLDSLADSISVVAVGARGSSIGSHVDVLRQGLKDLPVEISMVILEDLVDGRPAATEAVERAELVLTTLVYRRHVARLLGDNGPQVIVLMSEIAPEVTEQLLAVSDEARLVLVSKPLSRPIALGLLQTHGLRDQLSVALDLDPPALAAHLRDADVIVHTTDLTDLVGQMNSTAQTIALRIVLRPESVNRLREYIRHATGDHPH